MGAPVMNWSLGGRSMTNATSGANDRQRSRAVAPARGPFGATMKSKAVFAVFTLVGCFVGSALIMGQAPAPAGQGGGRGGAPQGPVVCQGTPAFAAQQTAATAAA